MALSTSGAQAPAQAPHEASAEPTELPEHGHGAALPAPSAGAPAVGCSTGDAAPAALPAMFWDTLPEGDSQHPDKLAMDAMMEELSPAERAANFKV